MDVVFLDANVLFSAAYRSDAGLRRLWERKDIKLVTSDYALEEARRNLPETAQQVRLERLARRVSVVSTTSRSGETANLPTGVKLPDKDLPILLAAIDAKATHLLTGDVTHFGPHLGKKIRGVLILTPGKYLAAR